jgi:neutral ceramidase
MKMFKRACLLALICGGSLLCVPGVATAAGWQAGVAKVNISPELPIWLSGYGSRDRPATTKHDDLWTKALVIEDAAGQQVVLVTVDLAGIPRELSTSVCESIEKKYKLPRSAIALCASHTHSGPVVRGNLMAMYSLDDDQGRRINEYKLALTKNMVSAVDEAFKAIKPAKLSWGIGEAKFAINRRNNPEGKVKELIKDNKLVGPFDHSLPVLAIKGEDGKLLAVVGGYACHATVLSDYFISADWPGAAQNELERRHPGALALFVAGCGGDQNPLPRRSIPLMEKYGREFADGVDAVLRDSLKPLAPTLTTAYAEIDLPFGTLPTRAELEVSATKEKPEGRWAKYMLKKWDQEGGLIASYPYPVQAWRLGNELTWILLGGEVVVDYSLRLKTELGTTTTWVSSYSNDVMAYIPSRRVLGEGGYEGGLAKYPYGLPAPWGATVEDRIVEEVHKLAAEVDKGSAKP